MDSRPERVYGILVGERRVFVARYGSRYGLPGGEFRPMAEDRKVELAAHLEEQLGIEAKSIWAQGAFDYQHPSEDRRHFSGFYSVWDWEGDVRPGTGIWVSQPDLEEIDLVPSLRILLFSILDTVTLRTR